MDGGGNPGHHPKQPHSSVAVWQWACNLLVDDAVTEVVVFARAAVVADYGAALPGADEGPDRDREYQCRDMPVYENPLAGPNSAR